MVCDTGQARNRRTLAGVRLCADSLSTAPMVKVGEIVGKDSLRNGKSVKSVDTGEGINAFHRLLCAAVGST